MSENKKILMKQVDDLSNLHKVITKNYHHEHDLFKEYLAVGTKIFSLETGIVSFIDNDIYTIVAFTSPLEGLETNMQFPLKDTYCREVYEANKSVAFPRVGKNEKMCNHPVYINMKLESYISAPIFINGKLSGTINFTDRKYRDEQFSSFEFQMIEIMAKTVGRFLEAQKFKCDLAESNKKMNELIGIVSHDLRNPIGNIAGCAEMVRELTTDSDALKFIQLIESSANDSLEMIENILQISAIRGGKISLKKETIDIENLIIKSWETIEYRAIRKDIKHKLTCTTKSKTLNGDPSRLKQVFQNLFTNSIKFSNIGSTIETFIEDSGSKVLIKVIDHGVGMNAKQIKEIFDGTKTTSTPGTQGESGTGYGLPLVDQIIRLHKGEISATSTLDKGSTFSIYLKK